MASAQSTDKRTLRRSMRQRRRALSYAQQHDAAQSLTENLRDQPWFRYAHNLALYLPADGEIDTLPLMDLAWHHGKAVYLPVVRPNNNAWFLRCMPGDPLSVNRYGLLEPLWRGRQGRRPQPRPFWSLDLAFLPLVAFDAHGNRLGMGGGYYDRLLASGPRRPRTVGLAHAFQEAAMIPCDPWDQPLDAVATDKGWRKFSRMGGTFITKRA